MSARPEGADVTNAERDAWPPLPYEEWRDTKETLHRYVQIVGKIRMSLVPYRNHWWHVTLYPSTSGMTTGPMPYGGRHVEIEFDFLDHRLRVSTSDGAERSFALAPGLECASFYRQLFGALEALGVEVEIRAEPFDLGDSPAFPHDTEHDAYSSDAVSRYRAVLASTERVFREFAGRFNGKTSPIHVFWHTFDLAHARFSGRPAEVGPDADPVTAEAYTHEVIAFGFWAGDDTNPFPNYYSYTFPEPDGLPAEPLEPGDAEWFDTGRGSLALLRYDAVRESADPHRTLLGFFESAYQAGGRTAGWDLEAFATRVAPAPGRGASR